MRTFALAFVGALVVLALAAPAHADMTFTVTKDSTMDGNAGQLMKVSEPGFPADTYFLFVEGGMVRAYAVRSNTDGVWQQPLDPIYLVPATSITAGQTWAFLPMGGAFLTVAEAIRTESVTTDAGTFTCWKIDITALGSPGTVLTTFWFSEGVGLVAQEEYDSGGQPTWRIELSSYSATGVGYFPLVVGNTWDFVGQGVPNEVGSVGELKGQFSH